MLVLGPTCLWLQLSHRESLHTSHHCPGQLPSDTAPSSSIMASSTRSTEKILPAASQMRLWRLLLLPRQMMDRPLSNSTEESFSGVIFWWLKWSLNCQSNWQGTGRLMGSLGEGSANARSPLLLTKPITFSVTTKAWATVISHAGLWEPWLLPNTLGVLSRWNHIRGKHLGCSRCDSYLQENLYQRKKI